MPDQEITKQTRRKSARRAAAASGVGTFIEWYDYSLYAAAAALVFSRQFFGGEDPAVGLLASFATFAVGYFARPLGGIVFAHLGDRIGRKPVLMLTLVIMGLSSALIGALPSYQVMGVAAPALLVSLRIAQGLGSGAEYAGAMTLATESAPRRRRGFYSTWSGSGLWLGSACGLLTFSVLLDITGDQFYTWGWRIPFLASILIVGVSLYVRSRVNETPHFKAATDEDRIQRFPLTSLLRTEKRRLAVGLGSNFLLSGYTYIPQVWALSYLTNNLGVAAGIALAANATLLLVGAPLLPLFGLLGDRVGRRRLFIGAASFAIVWTVPMFMLIETRSTPLIFLALIVCWVGVAGAGVGAQSAFLPELFPIEVRYSGIAFSREITGALLGGTAPLIATALYAATGHWWPIAIFMVVNAVVTLVAVYAAKNLRPDSCQVDAEVDAAPTSGEERLAEGSR